MRIRIRQETIYSYDAPVKSVIQKLRLTPRNYNGQHIANWRIEVDHDARLSQTEDAFGNVVHCFSAEGPFDALTTLVVGEVETFDVAGVVAGAVERFPPQLFLRETALTEPDAALRAFARTAAGRDATLDRLHALNAALHEAMTFDAEATLAAADASEAFLRKKGVGQDFAHVFIACARAIGVPARYVSGFLHRQGGEDRTAAHAWAEAYVEGLGWVGFDAAQGMSPNDAYVRVAAALDYLSAAPIRGARTGGGEEVMDVRLSVVPAAAQSQIQSQG
jgi:transglutaminase-like putative cysteine protease